jgi:nitrous oxide reductase
MSSLSRRHFLYAGGAAAASAAALAAAGGGGPSAASSAAGAAAAVPEEELVPDGEDHLVVYVSNTGAGEVIVMTDGHEVVFDDPQLVARVQRAARNASA